MDFDDLDIRSKMNNTVNVPLAWAMFGGSTFILFLLCYFCQKKLQDESVSMSHSVSPGQIYVVPTSVSSHPCRTMNPIPSPPPTYRSVIKKEQRCFPKPENEPPPSYEMAIAAIVAKDSSVTSNKTKEIQTNAS